MIEFFAWFGMTIAIFIGITGITALIGWMTDDDDGWMKWIIACALYACTTSVLINLLNK